MERGQQCWETGSTPRAYLRGWITERTIFWWLAPDRAGGGCIVITLDLKGWASENIHIMPFSVPWLAADCGGLPSIMELLDSFNLSGIVF